MTDIAGATGSRYVVTKADVGKQLRVVVRATAQNESAEAPSAPTPVVQSGAVVQVASVAPSTADAEGGAPQLVVDREQRSVQVKHGAQIVVTGRLVDADARPIADAVVDVFEQVTVVGAPWQKISTVTTDSQGGYSFRPTTTGSRTLRFAYSATRQAGEYRATREVVISVLAGMEIRALRRTVPASGLIALRGRVRAKPLPAAGTWVEVQVLDAGIWRTVATRRTSKTGRWSFTHRVRRTANVTFAFRARLRQLADVPSIESKSATVKVRVR
ncbi:MAG: carboxypeptidase-like regulatory domain-containing protein [Patulibacter minatonensis]